MKKLALLSIIAFLLCLAIVSATDDVNVTRPATNGVVSGVFILNATNSSQHINITYQARSASTANSTFITICQNLTGNFSSCAFDSTILEDGNNYVITAFVNNTAALTGTNVTGIIINNTVPTAPTSLTTTTQTSGTFTLTGTVTGSRTTSCTMQFFGTSPLSGQPPAGTHTGNTCSFAITNANEGAYSYTMTASDGTETATSSPVSFTIKTTSGGAPYNPQTGQLIAPEEPSTTSGLTSGVFLLLGGAFMLLVLAVGLIVWFFKK